MNKFVRLLADRRHRTKVLANKGFFTLLPDRQYLQLLYWARTGKKLHLQDPVTFNEKIQWLKLYDRKDIYTKYVDKAEAKKYIAEIIGDEYIIPTLGVWDRAEDIDWSSLPDQFVLKASHDSGGVVLCKNKAELDIEQTKQLLTKALKTNYYKKYREWPYKNVPRRIIAERFLVDKNTIVPQDYKLMCFNGRVRCTFVCSDRYSETGAKADCFDRNWGRLPVEMHYPASGREIPKPELYEKMVELAEKLSAGIPFVRVDFYDVDGRIWFGEMTFHHGSGLLEVNPEEWDRILGEWIELPQLAK